MQAKTIQIFLPSGDPAMGMSNTRRRTARPPTARWNPRSGASPRLAKRRRTAETRPSVNGRGGAGAWRPRARPRRTPQVPGLAGVAPGLGAWPAWSGARAATRCRCLCAHPPRWTGRRGRSRAVEPRCTYRHTRTEPAQHFAKRGRSGTSSAAPPGTGGAPAAPVREAPPCYAGRTARSSSVREPMTLHGVDAFVEVVRQRIETEGLRPFSMRTGIPLGQPRSVVQGRASRYTTLQSIAPVMGMRLFIAPAEPGGMEAPPLPAELTRALDLPSDASVVDAVEAIDQDAVASTLRKGMRLVLEMTELATAAAELLPQVAGGSKTPDDSVRRARPVRGGYRRSGVRGVVRLVDRGCGEGAAVLGASGSPDVRPDSRRFAGRRSRRRRQGPPGRGGRATCSSFASARRWWSSAFGRSAVSGAWSATAWLICRDP